MGFCQLVLFVYAWLLLIVINFLARALALFSVQVAASAGTPEIPAKILLATPLLTCARKTELKVALYDAFVKAARAA